MSVGNSFGCFGFLVGSFGTGPAGGGADLGEGAVAVGGGFGSAANGGGPVDWGEGMIGFSGSSGSCERGIGLRKSAASILAVTASRSSIM